MKPFPNVFIAFLKVLGGDNHTVAPMGMVRMEGTGPVLVTLILHVNIQETFRVTL